MWPYQVLDGQIWFINHDKNGIISDFINLLVPAKNIQIDGLDIFFV